MSFLDESLQRSLVGAGKRNREIGGQRKAAHGVERYLASDLCGLAIEPVLLGEQQDRLAETGRPTERKELLGIVALAVSAQILRNRHRQRELATLDDRAPVPAAFRRRTRNIRHWCSPIIA